MNARYAVILAAGQGSRMKSSLYKVLHPVAGKAMVEHVLEQLEALKPSQIVTVVGCGAELVKEQLGNRSEYALQKEQLGTGHAVMVTKELLADKKGTTLVICGDTPLLTSETLEQLIKHHEQTKAKATVLTAQTNTPTGYGRIIRDKEHYVEKIVEQKDATDAEQKITEINTGTYCFDNEFLYKALDQVGNKNAQGEYYLTDVIGILKDAGEKVSAYVMSAFEESLGVNDRVALSKANQQMRMRINHRHMVNGVTFVDPNTTYIDADVVIGNDTCLEAGVVLKGETVIGSNCFIGAHSEIKDSVIEDEVVVTSSNIEQSIVRKGSDVGPYAHLRPQADIGPNVHIGNFVEVKNAQIHQGTKVGHLTYVGDATLGENINVGCGVIFVNYDGVNKYRTNVGSNSFIGSNSNLVAPLKVGEKSFIAAGSTITKDVPVEALAIARQKQENKEGYAKKLPPLQ